jgi:hypothetical protein
MLLQSSAALVLTDAATIMPRILQIDTSTPFQEHRSRMLYQLDALEKIVPSIEGPKFVFAHILVTHRPYVFGPSGEPINVDGQFTLANPGTDADPDYERELYLDQIRFVNSRMEEIVEEILKESETPPIIIIQSDHGIEGSKRQKMNILNAYYLPYGGDRLLYSTISPVNTFRIVFNHYFATDYSLLEDISYYSPSNSYDFSIVTNAYSNQ